MTYNALMRLDSRRSEVLQNSLLHAIKDAEVLHHFQVLRFIEVQLIGVLARLEWVYHGGRVGHAHLLGHLVGSCEELATIVLRKFMLLHTIITAKNESKDGLQTHQVKEVPRKTRNPLHIKVTSHNTGLQHGLETDSEREGQFHCKFVSL